MDSVAGDHRFVFVGGLHRSGTTRVTSMLGYHRLASVLLERQGGGGQSDSAQRVFDRATARTDATYDMLSPGGHLTEASPECNPESGADLWRSWAPYWDLSKPVLVQRASPNLLRSRFLQGMFPGSRFVMVTRHPIAVTEAAAEWSSRSRASRLEQWVTAHETMADDVPSLDHVLVVRYEDVVTDTKREYSRILEFLDLPWAPTVTNLDLAGNDAYFRSFESGSPFTRMATRRTVRDLGTRVEPFGYRLRAPYFVATARLGAQVSGAGTHVRKTRPDSVSVQPPVPASTPSPIAPAAPAVPDLARSGTQGELRSAARGGFAFMTGSIVTAVFQFGFLALATHTLEQSLVGAFVEALAVFTIANNTAELGADTGLQRFAPIFLRRRRQDMRRLHAIALAPVLVASTTAAVLLYLYAPQLVHLFVHHVNHKGTSTDLRILSFFLPAVTLTTVICAGLRAWTLRVPVTINSFLIPIARPIIFAGLLVIGITIKLAIIAWAAPTLAGFVIALVVLVAKIRQTPVDTGVPVAPRRAIFGEFWRFSLPRTFGAILQILVASLDVLLVGAFMSAKYAAAYGVASRYIGYGTFALAAVVASVLPQMSRLMDADDYPAVRTVYQSSTWWTIAASWPPLLVLAIFPPLFLRLFGHGYVIASASMTILALAMLPQTGSGPNGTILQMAGRSGVNLGLQAVSFAINLGLNIWLIPRLGLVGAAIAWLASIVVFTLATSIIIWRSFGVQPFGKGFTISAGAALGCYGVLGLVARLMFGTGLLTFALYAVVSSSLYAVLLFKWRSELNLDAFESLYRGVFRRARGRRAPVGGGR
jgi:O-antigen/teichoic acid export membrane protein